MDILKILTRGIKDPGRRPGEAAAPSINLPSAGNRANPQLFHDAVPSRKGKKRKRTKDGLQQDGDEDEADLSDVDYFAPKKVHEDEADETAAVAAQSAEAQPKRKKAKLLPEDECRQILRSHRLKFTLLSGRSEDAAAKASKTSKKDEEPSKKGTKEKDKKQFYPQPLNSFTELQDLYDVSPKLVENIAKQGFRLPTEVQMGSLPLLLKPKKALKHASDADMANVKHGVDFVAVAPTGSGKTVTFMIPAIMSVVRSLEQQDCPPADKEHTLQAIVVAPTHELAKQIVNEGRKLAMGTGVRIFSMQRGLQLGAEEIETDEHESDDSDAENEESEHKAEGPHEEDGADSQSGSGSDSDADEHKSNPRRAPRRAIKPDILVTTPKSLLNALSAGGAKRALPSVTTLVLDEADVLLDPLFRKQTLAIWKSCTSPSLRLTFWSATMASNIESLILKHTSRRPSSPPPLIRLVVGLKDTAVPNITHKLIYTATEPGKLLALRQLLHPSSSTSTTSETPLRPPFLIFTQTIPRATALHAELKYDIPATAGGSSRIAVLHSSLSPRDRSSVMARFRSGEVWILITTDVLARGVDFAGVNGVVSYDVPSSAAAYVHRAGRTGRAGREGGVAVTFYTKEDIPFVRSVANVIAASERQGGGTTGQVGGTVQKWLLDALPKVAKEDKRRLKVRGVEARRKDADKGRAAIGAKSSYDRRRENNRRGAIEGSKRRKRLEREEGGGGEEQGEKGGEGEWDGIDD